MYSAPPPAAPGCSVNTSFVSRFCLNLHQTSKESFLPVCSWTIFCSVFGIFHVIWFLSLHHACCSNGICQSQNLGSTSKPVDTQVHETTHLLVAQAQPSCMHGQGLSLNFELFPKGGWTNWSPEINCGHSTDVCNMSTERFTFHPSHQPTRLQWTCTLDLL